MDHGIHALLDIADARKQWRILSVDVSVITPITSHSLCHGQEDILKRASSQSPLTRELKSVLAAWIFAN